MPLLRCAVPPEGITISRGDIFVHDAGIIGKYLGNTLYKKVQALCG
jgi:hypothetical protein